MPATLQPPDAVLNPAERAVADLLLRQLGDDDVLLAGVRLTDADKDHEADLVVLMPDTGIVVVEVKGGSVSTDDRGRWWQGAGTERHEIWPIERQALPTKHAIRRYVEADPRWAGTSRTRVRWAHTLVTPYSPVPDDFALPQCPRSMIHGRDDLSQLGRRLRALCSEQDTGHRRGSVEDTDLICQILRGRHPMVPDVSSESDEREARADRLTQEQAMILDVTRMLTRVEVRGGAGSGKTMLAITQARQLTRGRGERKAQRVALLCYSIGLGEWFKRQFETAPRKERPAFIGRFEELGQLWGADISQDRNDADQWERRMPEQMARLAAALPDGKRFDAVIVDEAQDFAESWWTPLIRALRDEEGGGLYVYSDENQRIFARFGRPPVPLVPLVLDHNLRNTQQIAATFDPLTPMRMRALGENGPQVRFVRAGPGEYFDVAEDEVLRLLEQGWDTRHVALLTTGARHPTQVALQEQLGQEGYWRTFWDSSDVFYGHVLGCKGLERRAVVLCVNESQPRDRSRERLYVGLSRATDQLVVVGDPAAVREMGGDEVARRLGLKVQPPAHDSA